MVASSVARSSSSSSGDDLGDQADVERLGGGQRGVGQQDPQCVAQTDELGQRHR